MPWRNGAQVRAMDTGKLREEHSERVLEERTSFGANRRPLDKQQFESRNPQSSSEIDPRLKTSSFISTDERWTSVDWTVEYADSEVPSEESRIGRQQVAESRDPQRDDRSDNFHVTTNRSRCMDVEQIFQEMEQRMKQRFHRLDETWNQIPLIMEQLQQHVDETKNMDSAALQMKAHFIPANNDDARPASFSIDEAFNLTPSTSKDLDNSIATSFPRLRAYVSHLESTSASAIAEALVDENGGFLFSSPSDETSSLSRPCTESLDHESRESNSRLSLIVELAVNDEVIPLANSPLRLQEKFSSSHSCSESLGEGIGSQTNWTQNQDEKESMLTRHPCIEKITTKPSGDQPAYSCRVTWVESPASSTPKRDDDLRAKVSLLQSNDLLQSEENITWVEVPTKFKLREEIGSEAKLTLINSEDKSENIQKQSPVDKSADWESFVLNLTPSNESVGSTQSCTESMSTVLLRAEIHCQEANLCPVYEDKGIPTQTEDEGPAQIEPQLSHVLTVQEFRQTPLYNLMTKSSAEESECCCHFASVVHGWNASLKHACTSCDRCLSVALNGSLPERT